MSSRDAPDSDNKSISVPLETKQVIINLGNIEKAGGRNKTTPAQRMLNLGSTLLLGLVLIAFVAIVIYEFLHVADPNYREKRLKEARQLCIPKTVGELDFQTSVLSKLNKFFLCSEITKISAGTVSVEAGDASVLENRVDQEQRVVTAVAKALAQQNPSLDGSDISQKIDAEAASTISELNTKIDALRQAMEPSGPLLVAEKGVFSTNPWVLVAGSDVSVKETLETIELYGLAQDLPKALVFKTKNRFRTVFPFRTKQKALDASPKIEAILPVGSYVRNVVSWCEGVPKKSVIDQTTVYECY